MIEHVVVIPNSNVVNTSFVESQKNTKPKRNYNNKLFHEERSLGVLRLPFKFGRQCDLAPRPIQLANWSVYSVLISFFSFFFRPLYRLHLFVVCNKMDQQNQTIGFRTWHYKEYCLLLSLVWNNQTAAAATT